MQAGLITVVSRVRQTLLAFSGMAYRVLVVLVSALLLQACAPSGGAVLHNVLTAVPPPSPERRTRDNHLFVDYALSAPARMNAHIVASDGRSWPVYVDQWRPTNGEYRLELDGTVPGPGANERQVLPDGIYDVLLEAASDAGRDEARVSYVVQGADTARPTVSELSLVPARITPNFDAREDVTSVTYHLAKGARVNVFADAVLADGSRVRAWTGEELDVEAGEQRFVWDGTLGGTPIADGDYEVGVRARDESGNISEARHPLVVEAGGHPEAAVVRATIAPREIIRGNTVCLDATVRNTGSTVLRTQGPDPSYVYNSFESYSSIDQHRHVEQAGYWRLGLDWAGSSNTTGARFPYRWGFGRDLQPGEEVSLRVCVEVHNQNTRMVFFGGLIQENVAIHSSGLGLVEIKVTP